MRYYREGNTLFIRGSFRATDPVRSGQIRTISSILIQGISPERAGTVSEKDFEMIAARNGLGSDYLGASTTIPLKNLCVLQYDYITVFILAGIPPDIGGNSNPSTIIAFSSKGLSDRALMEMINIAFKAKSEALKGSGFGISDTRTDTIIAACEGNEETPDTSMLTEAGIRIRSAIVYGIHQAIITIENGIRSGRPSFFIFSRFKGEHWIEWIPENCPYNPCHFVGQRCDFCYCPLYPCGDESLGQWVESSNGGNVWNCSRCTLLHEPEVADYLIHHPEASKDELVHFFNVKK